MLIKQPKNSECSLPLLPRAAARLRRCAEPAQRPSCGRGARGSGTAGPTGAGQAGPCSCCTAGADQNTHRVLTSIPVQSCCHCRASHSPGQQHLSSLQHPQNPHPSSLQHPQNPHEPGIALPWRGAGGGTANPELPWADSSTLGKGEMPPWPPVPALGHWRLDVWTCCLSLSGMLSPGHLPAILPGKV